MNKLLGFDENDKSKLELVASNSNSKSEMLRSLGIRVSSGNLTSLTKLLNYLDIDVKHFNRKGWNFVGRYRPIKKKNQYSIEELLVENSPVTSSSSLKKKLFNLGYLKKECKKCGLGDMWNNEPITLQLDHINGNNLDNRIENLQILCPNCHSQTKTFAGKNMKKLSARTERFEVEYLKFRETVSQLTYSGNPEPSLLLLHGIYDSTIPRKRKKGAETLQGIPKLKKPLPTCDVCGKSCKDRRSKYCSYDCVKTKQSMNVPTKEDLISTFNTYKNFQQVGAFYHVSDNAVRKWCKKYGILNMVKRKSKEV